MWIDVTLPLIVNVTVIANCLRGICLIAAITIGTGLARTLLMPTCSRHKMPPDFILFFFYNKQIFFQQRGLVSLLTVINFKNSKSVFHGSIEIQNHIYRYL